MRILFFILYSLFNCLIFYAHIFGGLSNQLTDFIASIPNILLAAGYLILLIALNKKNGFILKTQNFIFTSIYLLAYFIFPFNVQVVSLPTGTYNYFNTNAAICDQNTKVSTALVSPAFWQAIKMSKCDVIVLQEVKNSDYYKDFVSKELTRYFNTSFNVQNYAEFIVASRYPMQVEYTANYQGFLSVLINFPNYKLRIINIHIWTPLEKRTFAHNSFANYKISPFVVRKQQTTELLNYLYNSTYEKPPTILIGDFNMLPTHSFIHVKLRRLNYKRVKSRNFLTPTFSTSIPVIEIDHVFTNRANIINKRTTLLNMPSDHTMQVIYLNIPK